MTSPYPTWNTEVRRIWYETSYYETRVLSEVPPSKLPEHTHLAIESAKHQLERWEFKVEEIRIWTEPDGAIRLKAIGTPNMESPAILLDIVRPKK